MLNALQSRLPIGFDFGKPYEARVAEGDVPAKDKEGPPKRPLRPVAALLGGFGKK